MAENIFTIGDAPTIRPAPAGAGGRRLAAGDAILGRYTVVRELGEGGMGVVYQCLDSVGGVEVAVKGLPPEVSRNEDEMDEIRANYQIVRKLRHPNIAGVATLEKDPDTSEYYLVMDLAAGTTLKRWARRHPDASIDAKLAIIRQVAAALDYAHAEKVIHRDVKPENVMVDDDGRVKVLDFGLAAQIRSSQSRTSNTVTSKGGTPGYKSPEQWLGRLQQAPADVYAFGVMAYWLFSGRLPFDGDDPVVLGHAVLSAPVEPIPDLPAHMNAALVKALAKAPDERFESCGEVVDALEGKGNFSRVEHVERVDGGGNGRARSPSGPQSVGSRIPRDRDAIPQVGPRPVAALKGWLAVAALVLVVVGGIMWHGHRQRQQDEARRQARIVAEQKAEAERLTAERKAQEAAARRRADEERKAKEEAERRRKAEEEARLAAERKAKDAATEIRIEAKVQQGKVARISDGDGFKARKDALEDVFIRAEAFYDEKARRWAEAGALYKDYIEQSKSVITLDGERQQALAKRSAAQAAFRNAEAEGAKTYAKDIWNGAVKTWNEAAAEFKRMEFASAAETFAKALREFDGCAEEAQRRKRAEEEKLAEKKRMAEAREAERRRQEEAARQAEARRRQEERRKALQSLPGKWKCQITQKTSYYNLPFQYEYDFRNGGDYIETMTTWSPGYESQKTVTTMTGTWHLSGNTLTLRCPSWSTTLPGGSVRVEKNPFKKSCDYRILWKNDGSFELRFADSHPFEEEKGVDKTVSYDYQGNQIIHIKSEGGFLRPSREYDIIQTAKIFRRVSN